MLHMFQLLCVGPTSNRGFVCPLLLAPPARLPPRGHGVVPGAGQPAGGLVCAQCLGEGDCGNIEAGSAGRTQEEENQ